MAQVLSPATLEKLQSSTEHVRSICVIAHVDHGKTTLSDNLISANGIISPKMAGQVRYMDDTEEEQRRRITMKSSSISLLHYDAPHRGVRRNMRAGIEPTKDRAVYLVNLVDSPGHVDFSADVSTALRVCDGALVVVDAVEGVCSQTMAVLRQAWAEGVRPCLVINKLDRLITELQLTPLEAYRHLHRVLEQVNVVAAELLTADLMAAAEAEADTAADAGAGGAGAGSDGTAGRDSGAASGKVEVDLASWGLNLDDKEEARARFSPRRGNVVFASARDGWAFSLEHFAKLFADRLGLPASILRKALWGEFAWKAKSNRVVSLKDAKKKHRKLKPMFAEFVLSSIHAVYDAVVVRESSKKTEKIIGKLGLKIPPRLLRGTDSAAKLRAIMRAWLPLADNVMHMVVKHLPSPVEAAAARVDKLWPPYAHTPDPEMLVTLDRNRELVATCAPSGDDCVVFVAKMVAVPRSRLPEDDSGSVSSSDDDDDDKDVFLAFARVFGGTLRPDSPLFVLGAKYDPTLPAARRHQLTRVDPSESGPLRLFMMMGRDLAPMDAAPAGAIVAIAGLAPYILKSGTLCSSPNCVNLAPLTSQTTPLVRVSLSTARPGDMKALREGLRLLNQADPCVQVLVAESGELQLLALGELHLERCLEDLQKRFARVAVTASPPIVNFQETIVSSTRPSASAPTQSGATAAAEPAEVAAAAGIEDLEACIQRDPDTGHVRAMTNNRACTVVLSARPLPAAVTKLLSRSKDVLQRLRDGEVSHLGNASSSLDIPPVRRARSSSVDDGGDGARFMHALKTALAEAGPAWAALYDRIWACGPKHCGPNLLVSMLNDGSIPGQPLWHGSPPSDSSVPGTVADAAMVGQLANSVIQGFQMATSGGPLCGEPMWGVCFVVEQMSVEGTAAATTSSAAAPTARATAPPVPPTRPASASAADAPVSAGAEAAATEGADTASTPATTAAGVAAGAAATSGGAAAGAGAGAGAGGGSGSVTGSEGIGRSFGPLKGQVMSAVKDGCKLAFEAGSPRLVEALYQCQLQCSVGAGGMGGETLGKLYAVIRRRRGRVIDERLLEGTQSFIIDAYLPVVTSFGFAKELRVKTSGAATSPQLVFSHWAVLDVDPFFQPVTDAEREEFGDTVHADAIDKNIARSYIDAVRRRKGLVVERKIVVHAEKQRNLSRKK